MKTLLSLKIVVSVIALCFILNACGSGSGDGDEGFSGGTKFTPPTGDGILLAGTWTLNYGETFSDIVATLTLKEDGTFKDVFPGGSATGYWTSSDGISITLRYSNSIEYPPTGSYLSGTASADRNSMTGSYLYLNPGAGIKSTDTWTTTRK